MRGILTGTVVWAALLVGCAQAGPGSGPPSGDQVDAAGAGGGGDDDGTGSNLGSGQGTPDAAVMIDAMPDAPPAQLLTKTIPVKQVGTNYWRGWISKSGTSSGHSPVDNTFTGETSPGNDLDSYLVFPLTGITASQVVDATLHLQVYSYTGDATETISVWDVTTPPDQLESTPGTVAIHDDLETGIKYGSFTVKATDVSSNPATYLTIPLNADAASGVKARLGQDFAIGMSMDTVPGYVLFSSNSEPETLELVIHYNP